DAPRIDNQPVCDRHLSNFMVSEREDSHLTGFGCLRPSPHRVSRIGKQPVFDRLLPQLSGEYGSFKSGEGGNLGSSPTTHRLNR
ncbi:MAG: hypothetical protein ACI8RZ_001466, partial [Myxococcota bacterium]